MLGIREIVRQAATQSVPASTTLVDATNLSVDIAANQTLKARIRLAFTVGAAGGAKFQVVVPAGGVSFLNTVTIQNTVAPATIPAAQTASAALGNALANAGTHFIDMELDVVNGATAGTVKIQFAQNSSDATACQLLAGSFMDVVKL